MKVRLTQDIKDSYGEIYHHSGQIIDIVPNPHKNEHPNYEWFYSGFYFNDNCFEQMKHDYSFPFITTINGGFVIALKINEVNGIDKFNYWTTNKEWQENLADIYPTSKLAHDKLKELSKTGWVGYAKEISTCTQSGDNFQILTFNNLRAANVQRCEDVFHKLNDWSPTDWACAMAGECGEACNEVKKLRRLDNVTNIESERKELKFKIAKELADLVIYADLLAARLDIDLGQAVINKFNEVSKKRGSKFIL